MPLRIENAIDLHCHYGPDVIVREGEVFAGEGVAPLDAVRESADHGYTALVLKSHGFASTSLAACLQAIEPRVRVFGGICTDHPTGGLNPSAVEAALILGAKIVWLPTRDSSCDFLRNNAGTPREHLGALGVLDDDGVPLPVVHEIAQLVRDADAVLATGHISSAEHYAVVKELAARGKVLVTHAGEELAGPVLSVTEVAELAALGAIIELTAMTCQSVYGSRAKTTDDVVAMIKAAGPARCTLSSDYGWSTTLVPRPVPGLRGFLDALWDAGLREEDLQTMVSTNPARLLGLDMS